MSGLSPEEKAVIKAYGRALRIALGENIVRIVLFGSRARGEGNSKSDIDILIELKMSDNRIQDRIADITVDYMLKYDLPLAPVTYTEQQWETNKALGSLFVQNVEREGAVI